MLSREVSVVMSVYNGSNHLCKTIDSILAQKGVELEFIIVNDGSSDESPEILDDYANKDKRVHVIHQQNCGLTAALANGVNHANYEFIARQDVGDFSYPDRLRTQLDYLCNSAETVAVGCGNRRIGPKSEFLENQTRQLTSQQVTDAFLTHQIALLHAASMFRKSAYDRCGGYREPFRFAQDHDLWYRLCEIGLLGECPEILFDIRIELNGISSEQYERQSRLSQLARNCYDARQAGQDETPFLQKAQEVSWKTFTAPNLNASRHARYADSAYFIGSQLQNLGDWRSREYFRKAIVARPLYPKAWAKFVVATFCSVFRSANPQKE